MNGYGHFILPVAVGALAIAYLGFATAPLDDPASGMHLQQFGRLPISDRGRPKPIDATARTDLTLISGRQSFYDDQKKEHSAVEWMLDALTASLQSARDDASGPPSLTHKVFRIDNDQVLSLLNLPGRPGSYRYSIQEMQPKFAALEDARDRVRDKKDHVELFDKKVMELNEHLSIQFELTDMDNPLLLNPADPDKPRSLREVVKEWQTDVHTRQGHGEDIQTLFDTMPPFLKMLGAYARNDPKEFNDALDIYQHEMETKLPAQTHRAGLEADFDSFAPFYQCTLLYVGVLLLTCLAWGALGLGWQGVGRSLNWSGLTLAAVTLVVHTGALVARMYLMNRWPVFVTNLYGTAIFIGWVCALLGLVFETILRNGIGNFVTAFAGFTTMIIAQYLAIGEDTMEMMRAVLDTNFWLATHVTSVNIGYAGTIVAAVLGEVFICWGVLTPTMNRPAVKVLGYVIYGAVCFATLFSFTGTVLGGIWADQSWGRFWGWDPKENGALLIVVWNALILHARWGGMVKQRGMAVLTQFGAIIVIWSWWGVNMLGVGLHAYANADPAMLMWVLIFVGVFLAIGALGLLPQHLWLSFLAMSQDTPTPPAVASRGRTRERAAPEPA